MSVQGGNKNHPKVERLEKVEKSLPNLCVHVQFGNTEARYQTLRKLEQQINNGRRRDLCASTVQRYLQEEWMH